MTIQLSVRDPIDVAVGARMRLRRKQLGLSQGRLAEALGVTFQQVQKYEVGANRLSSANLVRAAQCLETTVADLMGEAPGQTAETSLLHLLRVDGAPELLQGFANISSGKVRRTVLSLVAALGELEETHQPTEAAA